MFSIIKTTKGHVKNKYCFSRNCYLADYRSDIENLPSSTTDGTQENIEHNVNRACDVGSTCRVCEDGSFWVLNNQDKWVEIVNSSSSDSSSSSSSLDFATDEEVEEMLTEIFG